LHLQVLQRPVRQLYGNEMPSLVAASRIDCLDVAVKERPPVVVMTGMLTES
jgi:hypothetical protein